MRSLLTLAFLLIKIFSSVAQDPWKNVYRESAWSERDAWQRPEALVKLLNITAGDTVADIGCNEGYMTIKLADVVSGTGKVYAVDVNQTKLNLLEKHLGERQIRNVVLVKGDDNNPKLPVGKLDAVMILDTYHEMDEHDDILRHIWKSLRTGGRLLLCEPIAEGRRKLSRVEQEQKHELGINFALADLGRAGFKIVYQKDPFVDRTQVKGDKMWVIVAEKK